MTTGSKRANALADRLEQGARALAAFASILSDTEWRTRVPHDGRTLGVTIHHVASMYPLEVQLSLQVAAGTPIAGVSWDDVHAINAKHAADNTSATKEEALELLRINSAAAAATIRTLTDEQLDQASPISLYGDAPLTCQFFLEDHPVRHSYHHLVRMQRAVGL
jgi:hypothetical protein